MNRRASKFGFLKENLQEGEREARGEAVEPPPLPSPAVPISAPHVTASVVEAKAAESKSNPLAPNDRPARRVGRPNGKRSDGEHVQVTAYIRKDTHFAVKSALLQERTGRDFSDLVEELLAQWLTSRT